MAATKPILVIHPGALGDVVVSFPALELLRRRFASVHLLCQAQIGKVAEAVQAADRAYPIESARFAGLYGGESDDRLSEWLNAYGTVAFFTVFSKMAELLQRRTTAGVFCVAPRPDAGRRVHTADHLLAQLEASGLTDPVPAKNDQDLRSPDADPAAVLIHPGAGSRSKRWPVDRFFELARRLEAGGKRPFFFLGPAERDLEEKIRGHPWPIEITDDLCDLLARLLRSNSMVGNDSGVSHLAAYAGLGTVAVFGPTDPVVWAPRGRAAAAVAAPALRCSVPDSPDPADSGGRLLEAVTVDAVLQALRRVLQPEPGRR